MTDDSQIFLQSENKLVIMQSNPVRAILEIRPPGEPVTLRINRESDGETMVEIMQDGTLTFGEDYDPDEAAWTFWAAVQRVAMGQGHQGV